MSYIAFVSTFPTEVNMRDGYYRRVHHVDEALSGEKRVHLDIRFAKNWRKRIILSGPDVQVMHLNAFLHFFRIWSVLRKAGIVYTHSIAKVPSIWIQWIMLKNRVPFALDLHGVMVDELQLAGNPVKAWFYSYIERFCFKHSNLNIYVSEVMQAHYRTKYPSYHGDETIFSTITNSKCGTRKSIPGTRYSLPDTLLPLSPSDVVIIYSGNCQPWQNIDLMLETMQRLSAQNIKFLILSGQKKHFERMIRLKGIPDNKILVISVTPDELESYYESAHYGFILRDDILVNRVANPTKLAEYLQYGIIPIVKSVDIGDYAKFDYEYLRIEELSNDLVPRKSQKNRDICLTISNQYGSESLRNAIRQAQKRYMTPTSA